MPRKRRTLWIVLAVIVVVLAGGYFIFKDQIFAQESAEEEPALQTSVVRQGSIEVIVTGAGTLIPASDAVNLGFDVSGDLVELAVSEGDLVSSGDLLARLDDTEAQYDLTFAEFDLVTAERNLQLAQINLEDTIENAEDNIVTAYTNAVDAEAALAEARAEVSDPNSVTSLMSQAISLERLWVNYDDARKTYEAYQSESWISDCEADPRCDVETWQYSAYEAMVKAEQDYRLAEAQYNDALANLQDFVDSAEDKVETAYAAIVTAEESIDEPTGSIASSEWSVAQAEIALEKARLALEQATERLEQMMLYSPSDALVAAIDASVGDTVSGPFITLDDPNQPIIEFFVDESDLGIISLGQPVEVIFDAYPDDVFYGAITFIDTEITSIGGSSAIRGLAEFDPDSFVDYEVFPTGMSATVDVIAGRAENTLLVPIEAVRELDEESYAVFVMEGDEPVLRVVQVGLMDDVYAEIISGVEQGEVVSTGIVETN